MEIGEFVLCITSLVAVVLYAGVQLEKASKKIDSACKEIRGGKK